MTGRPLLVGSVVSQNQKMDRWWLGVDMFVSERSVCNFMVHPP